MNPITQLQYCFNKLAAKVNSLSTSGSSAPVVQNLLNGNDTIAAGTTVAKIPALTASRFYELPLASGYANGSTLTILDSAGSLSASVVANISSATDIINGANPLILSTPYASPILISNGVDKWTLDIRGVSRGGTGATTASGARTNLGLGTGDSPTFTAVTLGASGNLSGGTNLIEQRNGASTPQAFRVYNTFPNSTANEWLEIDWQKTANVARIGTAHAGGGSNRELYITAGTNIRLFSTGGSSVIVRNSGDTANLFEVSQTAVNVSKNLVLLASSYVRMAVTAVNSLPAANTAGAGARMFVNDALSPVFGSPVVNGGAVTVPVYSTGSAWNVG